MNPQQNLPQDTTSDPFTEPATVPQVTEQPTMPISAPEAANQPKKSHKRAIILLLIGLVFIIGAIGAYAYYMQATTPATNLDTKNVEQPVKKTSEIEATTDIMTDATTEEAKLGETNDTTEVSDADDAAGTVEESFNENNL